MSKEQKRSIYVQPATKDFITATTSAGDDGPKWSNGINTAIEQYRWLLAKSLPDLSTQDWERILSTYAGSYMPAHRLPARIASDMMDDMGEISLDAVEKSLPEKADLIKKVYAMTQIEQMAILYFVQIFWLNDWSHCQDFEQIKSEIVTKLGG